MLNFDYFVLTFMLIFSASFIAFAWSACRDGTQRLLVIPFIFGFFLYNGFAISIKEVPGYMVIGYFIFLSATFLGFRIGVLFGKPIGATISKSAITTIRRYAEEDKALLSIWLYFILVLTTLSYPDFRVHLLLSPPSPDLAALFESRFTVERGFVVNLVEIAITLITPLYFLALYRFRRRPILLFFVLFAPLYLIYVRDAYISRYFVLIPMMIYFAMLWESFPRWRISLVSILLTVAPLAAALSIAYTYIRLGADPSNFSIGESFVVLFSQEAMLPFDIGVPLVESGKQANLAEYFIWLLTLPVPGFLKSGLPIIRLNYEISEIVLGLPHGSRGFYVVLPGLLAESIFLFGRVFFFVHALSLGLMMGMLASVLQRVSFASSLVLFLSTLFFFVLNRGGIASVAPVVVNGFLLFALIVFFSILRVQAKRKKGLGVR